MGGGGIYQGDGTTCDPDPCLPIGACCSTDGSCVTLTEQDCTSEAGTSWSEGVACDAEVCMGACCFSDLPCAQISSDDCTGGGGIYEGDGTTCDPDPCPQPEACCFPDAHCEDLTPLACGAAAGGVQNQGALCVDTICPIRIGACCFGTQCQDDPRLTEEACMEAGGVYQGDESDCNTNPCPPPNNAIDARQPSDPDGLNPTGWTSMQIPLHNYPGALEPTDFIVSVHTLLDPPASAPAITAIDPSEGTIRIVQFDTFIPPAHWTKVTHVDSDISACLGYLPADVSGDGTSGPWDILQIIDCANGVLPCAIYQGDGDRSEEIDNQDVRRVIELLEGADSFEVWNGISLPASPCGSGPG